MATKASSFPPIPAELIRAISAGECVLYAGAGASAQVGFPIWSEFVRSLTDWAERSGRLEPQIVESVHEALHEQDLALVADTIVSRSSMPRDGQLTFGTGGFEVIDTKLHEFLLQEFLVRKPKQSGVHQRLTQIPFSAVLTTNFDDLFERNYPNAPVYTHEQGEALLSALASNQFFILKLYGSLNDAGSVLVSPSQYHAAVESNRLLARFMETIFVSRTILFLGASLEGITDYLGGIRFAGQSSREHYAFVDVTGSAWKVKADVLKRRYGITVLSYPRTPGWPQLTAFVRELARATGKQTAHPQAVKPVRPQSLLIRRLELFDIGPFEHLSIEFSEGWNVLLGDNGVGKSSILKAIAAALCGTEAQSFAHRLIRVGRSKGSIALETSQDTYVVELYRTEDGAEMRTHRPSPLHVENWLALGFPPLRALSWNRTSDNVSGTSTRANAADLMPLVRGDLDPRLDALRNWLIQIQDNTRLSKTEAQRQTVLRNKLFEVIAALTPGLRLEYVKVDDRTREVTVKTDDGELPLEAISQGTSSLIGWIGVALQRMFEVYSSSDTPWNEPALILIDEVDAHMHPAWQQHLSTAITEQFPSTQIIATTHSPLIVSGMAGRDIHFLHRENGAISVNRLDIDFTGWRADQILTHPAFGLYSTLAPAIQRDLDEYGDLLTRDDPSDEPRLKELAMLLKGRIPSSEEREEARVAYELIREWLKQRKPSLPPEQQKEVLRNMRLRLQDIARSYS